MTERKYHSQICSLSSVAVGNEQTALYLVQKTAAIERSSTRVQSHHRNWLRTTNENRLQLNQVFFLLILFPVHNLQECIQTLYHGWSPAYFCDVYISVVSITSQAAFTWIWVRDWVSPCASYSKQTFACIPMAAFHINTSSVQVRLVLIWVVSVRAPFLGNQYE